MIVELRSPWKIVIVRSTMFILHLMFSRSLIIATHFEKKTLDWSSFVAKMPTCVWGGRKAM